MTITLSSDLINHIFHEIADLEKAVFQKTFTFFSYLHPTPQQVKQPDPTQQDTLPLDSQERESISPIHPMRALPPSEPTALQRGHCTSDLEGKAAAPPGMDGEDENMEEVECIIEEEEEEEELTHDDIIEDPPNENESVQDVFQDNETLQLLSSDDERECPMSPNFSRAASKVDPPELENTKALQERMEEPPATQPSPGGEEESEKRKGLWDEDVKNGSAFEGWGWNGHPHVETQEQKKKDDDEMEKTIAEMSEELEKALKSEDETEAKDKNTTKGTFKVGQSL